MLLSYVRGMQISYNQQHVEINSITEGSQGREVQVGFWHEEGCQRHSSTFQRDVRKWKV